MSSGLLKWALAFGVVLLLQGLRRRKRVRLSREGSAAVNLDWQEDLRLAAIRHGPEIRVGGGEWNGRSF